jgi:hypothetical protein
MQPGSNHGILSNTKQPHEYIQVDPDIEGTKAFAFDKSSKVWIERYGWTNPKFPCCSSMQQMVVVSLIQWKQRHNGQRSGFYFCSGHSMDAHTNTRKGVPFIFCPYCGKRLPTEKPEIYKLK